MANHIGFHVWYQIFDEYSQEQQNLIVDYIKKICALSEKDINLRGGIAGKKIKIYIDIVEPKTANKNHFLSYLKNNKDIHFLNNLPNYDQININDFDFENYIHFDGLESNPAAGNWNVYQIPFKQDINSFEYFKNSFPDKNLIIVVNDGYINDKNISNKSLKHLDSKITAIDKLGLNYKIFKDLHNKKSEFSEYVSSLSDEDYIVLSPIYFNPIDISVEENNIAYRISLRKQIISTFLKTTSKGSIVLTSFAARESFDRLNDETCIPDKKVYSIQQTNHQVFLRMQDIHNEIDENMDQHISNYLNWWHKSIDTVNLIKYIFDKKDYVYSNREEFLLETTSRLKFINGVDDIFVGDSRSISFDNNRVNKIRDQYMFEHKRNSQENNSIDSIFYKDQLVIDKKTLEVVDVLSTSYANINILKFSNISIEDGIFTAKFYFELTTKYEEAIKIISFNNSTLDASASINKVSETIVDEHYKHYKYLIEDTFSFNPIPDNYPFDKQMIYIDYSIIDKSRFGILQPIQKDDIDLNFVLDGWNLLQGRSGIYREKVTNRTILSKPSVNQILSNRVGWLIQRSSSMTMLKISIPLAFLWMLVLYGLFLPIESLDRSVAVITTSFLSGIALYFSTERPQPLRMTVIDFVFAFFYLTVGVASMAVFTLNFFPDIYNEFMGFIKYSLPVTLIFGVIFLKRRINSKFFQPRTVSDSD